ncbi:DDE-type integrase/transposase/recombinase [Azospirillum sp. Sh1]|uniref:DDE-type integrase/transposase/recombinase n=1 Tax=Azospirillum sp. Sh1 TaxID=2607285 RepID=UPI0011EECA9D|nr:DDE-type integrase/transposase/recombinase [Azospirillum sp. Sh1]KAA0578201.1 DDE-type integrase/transposase/recombinase [Azospirillum sp. Sh1]
MNAPRILLRRGQRVEIDGRFLRFDRYGRGNEHIFEDEESEVPGVFGFKDLVRRVEKGTFALALDPLPAAGNGVRKVRSVEDLDDEVLRTETLRRLAYMLAWQADGKFLTSREALQPIIAATAVDGEKHKPGISTLRRWIGLWRNSGGDPLSLIPGIRERGNRRRQISPLLLDLVREGLDEHYLKPDAPSATSAHQAICKMIDERNASLPQDSRIAMPTLSLIYREVGRIDRYTLIFERYGKAAADRAFRPVGDAPPTARHNEVWEIDHTKVEGKKSDGDRLRVILTLDRDGAVIGEAWLTLALDRCTRMPMGWTVGFAPPSRAVAFSCLRHAILPKGYVADRYPEIRNEHPAFGAPGAIVVDNAAEFRSDSFVAACALLGIEVRYAPVAQPWHKGKIERFFRSFTEEVCQRVPGTRFAAYFQKHGKEPPPDEVATATLEEFRLYLHQWLIDVYSARKHRGLDMSPRDAWEQSVRTHGLLPPPGRNRLDTALVLVEHRTPQRYGIDYERLRYNSAELAAIRIAPGAPRDVTIRVDPDDLGAIRVRDPETNRDIRVSVIEKYRAYAEGLSLDEHAAHLALIANNAERFIGDDALLHARDFLRKSVDSLRGQRRRADRNRAARFLENERKREARRQADRTPVEDARPISDVLDDMLAGAVPSAPIPAEAPPPNPLPASFNAASDLPPTAVADEDTVDLEAARRRLGIDRNLDDGGYER